MRPVRTSALSPPAKAIPAALLAAAALIPGGAVNVAADSSARGADRPCGIVAVAAAADLEFVMPDLASQFEQASGCKVRVSIGSSGNFFSQIENGAPFDIFFSADADYPKRLEAEGLTVPGSAYRYALGKIVLWVRKDSELDPGKGLAILGEASVRKIAIANPEHAPYGRAAEQALRKAGLYDAVKGRLVLGENISQAAQFVESGNADVGILALSLAVSPVLAREGRYARIPDGLYASVEQTAVLIGGSRNPQAAQEFLDFVKTPAAAAVLGRYGFAAPGKEKP